MKICKKCNHKNPIDALYCIGCNELLIIVDSSTHTKIGRRSDESCKKCNYPLAKEHTHCLQCGTISHLLVVPVPQQPDPTPIITPHNQTTRLSDISIVDSQEQTPIIVLVPVKKPENPITFEGTEISINRETLDPNNKSISGQSHALLTSENNRWYITDQSSNEATFVQVKGKVELTNEMQILIGNTFFTVQITP